MEFFLNILQNLNQQTLPLSLSLPIITFIVILFLVSTFLLVSRFRPKLPYPPGPRGLPFIGNMMLMNQLTHRGLYNLAKKYGGLFYMKMGYLHTVTVSSSDVAREVLQAQDSIFSNRPATIAIAYLTYQRADMAFAHYGPFWRQMRKLCVMRLFSRKRAESWESVREEVDRMMRTVASETGSPVNLGELVFVLTRDIIYRAAFGTSSDAGRDDFIKILQEFSKLFGAFNIADFVPSLTWVDPQRLNDRLAKARCSLDKFIDRIIDDHMVRKKPTNNNESDPDMVDDLLAFYVDAKASESDHDLQNSIRLTRENIKAIIMDVMFGGTETVASAIEWALSELMKSPDDLKKAQQELAQVVGLDRRVNESDFEKLTFLKCVIKETLRLHPPIPLLLHETAVETEVSGYRIPAKCRVTINAYAIGRDPKSWSDPDTFRPSRFLEENVPDFKGNHFEFIPFGSGRRSCPGMQLGLYALEMAVANLLHGFTWELADGMKPSELDMNDVFGLTAPRATRLIAVPTPRLMCPIY